jgi:hypothetical protein
MPVSKIDDLLQGRSPRDEKLEGAAQRGVRTANELKHATSSKKIFVQMPRERPSPYDRDRARERL